MLSCTEATRLMSDSRERPLLFKEKVALTFHTSMCKACRNFGRQVGVISKLSKHYVSRTDKPEDEDSK
ncbi:MAG: zf-HC2 domain-containing protein [Cellvibrionaceae bacterium]